MPAYILLTLRLSLLSLPFLFVPFPIGLDWAGGFSRLDAHGVNGMFLPEVVSEEEGIRKP